LLLSLLVVVVVLLVVLSGVTNWFPRQFQRVPAESGPGADRIVVDLSGAVGSVVVSAVVVVVFVVGRSHQASSSIPRSSGQFRARSRWDLFGSVGGSGLFCGCWCCCCWWWWWCCCWWCCWVLPIGFHVNSSEFRPIQGPELTGSGWICRGQRVVLLLLVLL
jgi:hypothetical protein